MNKSVKMKLATLSVAAVAVISAGADTTNRQVRGSSMVRATGGWVTRTTDGTKILLADARKVSSDLEAVRAEMQTMLNIPVLVRTAQHQGGVAPYGEARGFLSGDAGLVVFVYDGGSGEPVMSTFPENRIALVNITPIVAGVDREKGLSRIEKELWRAVAYLAGNVFSTMPSVMRPVFAPSDLDGLECRTINPMEANMINTVARNFGLARIQRTTYRSALRQGWAPPPTNEFQKAIWEKEHAVPKNPMKIEFDPKKGK